MLKTIYMSRLTLIRGQSNKDQPNNSVSHSNGGIDTLRYKYDISVRFDRRGARRLAETVNKTLANQGQ